MGHCGIIYLNKRLQTIQNQGLYIVFNQHFLSYTDRDSTEVLHRNAKIVRMSHRRKAHMLTYIFNYKDHEDLLDNRDLPTRRHDGLLFKEMNIVHHKARQNPLHRAILGWNSLPVEIRNVEKKELFKKLLISSIHNPYKTFV